MIRLLFYLWESFIEYSGANLIDIATLTLLVLGGWKLFCNHLKHLKIDINNLKESDRIYRDTLDTKISKLVDSIRDLQESVRQRDKICEERHK
jgi:hypothetical protein